MTFWLDAHLDPNLAAWLGARFGVSAKHVKELALDRATDREIFDAGRRFGAIVIVSKDSDFVDLVTLLGAPPQVLRLTFGNLSTVAAQAVLAKSFPDAMKLLESGAPWVDIR
jgi:predicted nuclease of predicted toxin-antitoxin system